MFFLDKRQSFPMVFSECIRELKVDYSGPLRTGDTHKFQCHPQGQSRFSSNKRRKMRPSYFLCSVLRIGTVFCHSLRQRGVPDLQSKSKTESGMWKLCSG